jgi:hypothetical protein
MASEKVPTCLSGHVPQVLLDVLPGNIAFVIDEVADVLPSRWDQQNSKGEEECFDGTISNAPYISLVICNVQGETKQMFCLDAHTGCNRTKAIHPLRTV